MSHVRLWNCSLDFPDPLRASQAQRSLILPTAALLNLSIKTIRQTDNLMESFPKPSALNQKHLWDQAKKKNNFWGRSEVFQTTWKVTGQTWANHNLLQLMCAKSYCMCIAGSGKQRCWTSQSQSKKEKILSCQGFVSDYLFLFAALSNEETLSRCYRNAARADLRCRSRHLQVFPHSSALAFSYHLPV